ncbi:MAG: transglycosylase domain-containing protein [Bilophila wadsworthia]
MERGRARDGAGGAALRGSVFHGTRRQSVVLLRASAGMLGGARRMGGSTITMQVAPARPVHNHAFGQVRADGLALQYEYHYGKGEILEAYFNLAPYGGNIEGVGAAARIYFRTTSGRLTRTESLALAVVPQNPVRRSPLNGPDFEAARARMQMLADAEDAPGGGQGATASFGASGFALGRALPPLRVYGPARLPFGAPHVSSETLPLSRGGEPVRTCIDSGLQRLMERVVAGFAARGRRYGLNNAAALLIHWPSMEIRGLVGSAGFSDAAISGQVDGTRARRSPGSTLKPFIYGMALDQGLIHPQTLLPDSPRSFGGYDPENFDRVFAAARSWGSARQP